MAGKTIVAFILGAAVGSGITFLVTAKHFNKKSNEEIESIQNDFLGAKEYMEEEIKELRQLLDGSQKENENLKLRMNTLASSSKEVEDDTLTRKLTCVESNALKNLENKPEPEDLISGKVDYTQFSTKAEDKKVKIDPDIKTGTDAPKNKKDTEPPYLISSSTFYTHDDVYEKVELRYFVNDNLFLGEDGDLVSVAARVVGKNNINALVNESNGEIYVRNENTMCDYHVQMDDTPYEDYKELIDDLPDMPEDEED